MSLKFAGIGKLWSTFDLCNKAVILEKNIEIGDYSYIAYRSVVFPNVTIGRYCSISFCVKIGLTAHPSDWLMTYPLPYGRFTTDHKNYHPFEMSQKTIIGNDVWIGANALIKAGVIIGDGAIIAAGAVIVKDVPPYAIVGGSPAKIIKYRFSDNIIKQLLELKWWDLDIKVLKENKIHFHDINKAIGDIKRLKTIE